jgi:DNA-binding transcriptional MerR regulator
MKIGELARLADVGVDTVRFYERRGVLPPPARRASGYRDYGVSTAERLRFAKALQRLGFTLDEVVLVLGDVDRGEASCAGERARFEGVLARVDAKLAELRAVRRRLAGTLRRCAEGHCRLLESPRTGLRPRTPSRKRDRAVLARGKPPPLG